MLTLRNEFLLLTMQEDGTQVVFEDLQRRTHWRLDEKSRIVACNVSRYAHANMAMDIEGSPLAPQFELLGPGKAEQVNATTIRAAHSSTQGAVVLRWQLEADRLQVFAEPVGSAGASMVALPGAFRPEPNDSFLAAMPVAQGILHNGKGPSFYRAFNWRGHAGFTLCMFGQLAARGGLAVIAEDDADVLLHWEKTPQGDVRVMWVQQPSFAELAYPRQTVIFATANDLTSVCKAYRRYEIEKGRFKNWHEKIAERPNLEKLFGACNVFLGYQQDPDLDYADSFRRLQVQGIDRAHVYPVFCGSTIDSSDIGLRGIDIRPLVPQLLAQGYLPGSFIYTFDGQAQAGASDPRSGLRLTEDGQPVENWRIRDAVWYSLSVAERKAATERAIETELSGLQAVHFDVLCNREMFEDYHPAHRTDARTDVAARIAILEFAKQKGLVISSEGFNSRMTPYYDMASTKLVHCVGQEDYSLVPMTMLVYHDSVIHTWWEVDNYNNPEHRSQFGRGLGRFPWGGGFPRLQSAWDALLGTAPDIFPFGRQYNFVPWKTPEFYLYEMRLEQRAVQQAICCAKPVMALHRRIGKLEMTEHKLHRPDGAVQETVFADGTRVLTNFANVALEAPGIGLLPPQSWQAAGHNDLSSPKELH